MSDVIATYDTKDPTAAPPHVRSKAAHACAKRLQEIGGSQLTGLRIGVPQVLVDDPEFHPHTNSFCLRILQEYFPAELQPAVIGSTRRVIEQLRARGATIVPVSLPSTPYALSAYYVISSAEASSNLARYDGIEYGALFVIACNANSH